MAFFVTRPASIGREWMLKSSIDWPRNVGVFGNSSANVCQKVTSPTAMAKFVG